MTIAFLHLIRLSPTSLSPDAFITLIHQHALSYHYLPLITSRARHWVSRPSQTHTSALNKPWDLLIVLQPLPPALESAAHLPTSISWAVADQYSLRLAIPSRLLRDWPSRNESIRREDRGQSGYELARLRELSERGVKGSSQALEASGELLEFARVMMESGTGDGRGPVTMLNLLRFNAGEPGQESYKTYGQAFATDVGKKRGGNAKIVGKVLPGEGNEGGEWAEVAIVHYPK